MPDYNKAIATAILDLKENYGKRGLYASPARFKNYWARDSFISSFGACAIKDFEIVEKDLEVFIHNLRHDGHVPARIEESPHVLESIGIVYKLSKLKVLHKQSQPWATDVYDSNPWLLLAAVNFFKKSGNTQWLKSHQGRLERVADWIVQKTKPGGLIWEGYTANWSDCSLRRGYLLYTNVLSWGALHKLSKMKEFESKGYDKDANKLKEEIIKNFWNEKLGYFHDTLVNGQKEYDYFYTDGNILAIWLGLADEHKSKKILSYIDKFSVDRFPVASGYPKMDRINDFINKTLFPVYRTTNSFLWLGLILVLARLKAGDVKGAVRDFDKITESILIYGTCYEVLDKTGKPPERIIQKSERKQAWTAALYLYSYTRLKKYINATSISIS